MASDCTVFGFDAEWHDPQADIVRPYNLTVYAPKGGEDPLELQMYDPKAKRMFLKKAPILGLRVEDLFEGSTITVHARQITLKACADDNTRRLLEIARDEIALLTAPAVFLELGQILGSIEGAGLVITRLRLVNDGGPVVVLQVSAPAAERKWEAACQSLRPGSCHRVSVAEALPYFEDRARYPTTACYDNCTLCLIRPHAVKAGCMGEIVKEIMQAGFEVSAAKLVHLSRGEAAEFLDVYKGVLAHYPSMIEGLSSAPCLALELRKAGTAVRDFRQFCGPHDVEIAKHLRPTSLRARFGVDNARNALHCTDLEEDGEMEVRYMFELIN